VCVVPMTGCAKWSVPLFMIEWMTSPRMIHDQKSGINNVHRSKPSHDSSAVQRHGVRSVRMHLRQTMKSQFYYVRLQNLCVYETNDAVVCESVDPKNSRCLLDAMPAQLVKSNRASGERRSQAGRARGVRIT